jgi:hypothetical protein
MALSKKQIAVILAMKNKQGGLPPHKSPLSPANAAPGIPNPAPIQPLKPVMNVNQNTIQPPKPPTAIKFPKLRIKMGF